MMGRLSLAMVLAVFLSGCPASGGGEEPSPRTLDVAKGPGDGATFEESSGTFRPADLPWAEVVARGSDGYLTLRSLPGTEDGERVAELPDGTRVRVYRCRDDVEEADGAEGSWCRVRLDPVDGYVFDAYVQPASGGPGTHTADVSDFLAVRSEASARSGRQVLRLLPGAPMTLGACGETTTVGSVSGRWCRASVSAYEGWVFGAFLTEVAS